MDWEVTYRAKDGKLATEVLKAASKSELFSILAEKGLSAIRVEAAQRKKAKIFSAKKATHKTAIFLILAFLVVAISSAIYLVVREKRPSNSSDDTGPKVKQIKPESSTPVVPKVDNKPQSNESSEVQLTKRERDLKQIRDLYGDNIPENLKPVVYFLEHPPKQVFKVKSNLSYFRHPSERKIAGVAFAEPGSYFVVKPEFDEAFNKDFINALVDKIEISNDDSDEVKAGKSAMTELKKEIADICRKEGKTPSEVMNEHASSMFELGRYQRDLEKEIERIQTNPDYTDADVEDFCKAANELLGSKGLPPMPFPDLTRRIIHIQRAQRQAEKRAEREKERN